MTRYLVDITVIVDITVQDGSDAISRVTGPEGDAWRADFYDERSVDDVLEHWAYNAVCNGTTHAAHLDGWSDLSAEAVTMRIDRSTFAAVSTRSL